MARISQKRVVEMVSELSGLTHKECRTVIDDYITVIQEVLKVGLEVSMPTLGIFKLKYKAPKKGRVQFNIRTRKEEMTEDKAEYNAPAFYFAPMFRQEVRELTDGKVLVQRISDKTIDTDDDDDGGENDG
jgi:nucleoid DNA-binding protein